MAAPNLPSFPDFSSDMYPPHLNAAIHLTALRALADANDPRGGYPGPLRHEARNDLTAVLMRMVEEGAISGDVAALLAWRRRLNPSHNGAYYSRTCAPRVVWGGLDYGAEWFGQLYSEECATTDIAVDGLPMTRGLGARAKPVAWLWVDDTLEWSPPLWIDRLRPSQRVLDVALVGTVVLLVPLLAWWVWQLLTAVGTLWPWFISGTGG